MLLCPNVRTRFNKGAEEYSYEIRLLINGTNPHCDIKETNQNETRVHIDHIYRWIYSTRHLIRFTALCEKKMLIVIRLQR